MNIMSSVVKLRTKFAEETHHYGEIFDPPGEPLKQYAMFLEKECALFKELLRRELENKEENSNSSPSGPTTHKG